MAKIKKYFENQLEYLQSLNIEYFCHSHSDIKPSSKPVLFPEMSKKNALNGLYETYKNCSSCELCKNRHNLVFGQGTPSARLMFVGEAPGHEEDMQGLPFVGRSGKLLDKILNAMDLDRTKVYIANIIKCRPPNNRNPNEEEIRKCSPIINEQIRIINPEVICSLGSVSFNSLIGAKMPISLNRGKTFEYHGIKLIPTYHPSYILRKNTIETKKKVWSDMKKIMNLLGLI